MIFMKGYEEDIIFLNLFTKVYKIYKLNLRRFRKWMIEHSHCFRISFFLWNYMIDFVNYIFALKEKIISRFLYASAFVSFWFFSFCTIIHKDS